MKLRFAMTSAIGVAVLSHFAAPASAVSLINETFGPSAADTFAIGTGTPVGAFTVSSGNIDLIGAGGSFDLYSGNGKYIDLSGSTAGAITSTGTFTFTNGGTLAFSLGANGASKSASVFIGTTSLGTVTASQGGPFTTQNFTIASGTSGALIFTSLSPGNAGVILDNIVLNSTDPVAAVPEPFTMIGTLIGGTAAIRLRKKLKVDSNV